MEGDLSQVYEQIPTSLHSKLKVCLPEDVGGKLALHVSSDRSIRKFIPMVSTRILNEENRNIPRICCSLSLSEAISGHSTTDKEFEDNNAFEGVFQVYAFDYECIVKPSSQLVPDAHRTGEYWLIAHSKETQEYVPRKVARFFYESITKYRLNKSVGYVLYLEVTEDVEFWITPKQSVGKGYYRIAAKSEHHITPRKVFVQKPMSITSVDKMTAEEFRTVKDTYTLKMESLGPRGTFNW